MNAFEYEEAVYKAVRRDLRMKRFGLLPGACETFRHKRYWSPARNGEIEVDIAVELTLPGSAVVILLWIWECKNYTRPVSVEDLEEFHAKLEQLGSDRTIGTIVTSSSFRRGAINYAKAQGISLVRYVVDRRQRSELHFHSGRSDYGHGVRIVLSEEERARREAQANAAARAAALVTLESEEQSEDFAGFVRIDSTGTPQLRGTWEHFLHRQMWLRGLNDLPLWRLDVNTDWHWQEASRW